MHRSYSDQSTDLISLKLTHELFIYLEKEPFLDRCRVLAGVAQVSSYMWVPSEAAEKWPPPLLVSSCLSRCKCFIFLKHMQNNTPTIVPTIITMISSTMKTARRATTGVSELAGSTPPVSGQKQSISVVVPDGNSSLNAGVRRRERGEKTERERERERVKEQSTRNHDNTY
jgi:hypothetical protein